MDEFKKLRFAAYFRVTTALLFALFGLLHSRNSVVGAASAGSVAASDADVKTVPDALVLLNEVAAAYRKLDSYEWTEQWRMSTDNGIRKWHSYYFTLILGAYRRPGHMRVEVRPVNEGPLDGTRITDGTTVWDYRPYLRLCCHPALTPAPPYSTGLSRDLPYERITEKLRSARFVGVSELTADGEKIACLAVNAIYEAQTQQFSMPPGSQWSRSAVTYWIHPVNKLVMQQYRHHAIRSTVFGRINPVLHEYSVSSVVKYRMNPSLPDSMFKFKIPAGGHEVQNCPSGGGGSAEF
jgi:outer membrane lipoprotein-sorting protein